MTRRSVTWIYQVAMIAQADGKHPARVPYQLFQALNVS